MDKKVKIYIYNYKQAYFYMKNGLMPIERPGVHPTTGNVYFVFDREATKPLFDKWCLKNNK